MFKDMDEKYFGDLCVIGMRGSEDFVGEVDNYLRDWRQEKLRASKSFLITPECTRFGTGEGKGVLHDSMRGRDVYIFADVFNYGVTYKMYGQTCPMSPDDHYQDLVRVIGAIAGKARRISVIMPMLYEGRQHKRSRRESLDCAVALKALVDMGVSNIITFDAHDARVQNAIPMSGFEDVHPTHQMIKALLSTEQDISLDPKDIMMISPDEGGMGRCIYYSSVLGIDLGMFYKRRDFTRVVDGRNPIVEHKYIGKSVKGKDVIIVDDMISSGESMLHVSEQLKEKGAKRIFMFSSFGLFCNGLDSFDKAYADGMFDRVFTTNLIYRTPELKQREWYHEVNLTKYVALIIDTLNRDESISTLLNPVERIHNFVDNWKKEQKEKSAK